MKPPASLTHAAIELSQEAGGVAALRQNNNVGALLDRNCRSDVGECLSIQIPE
jgi:hypothetical protein